MEHYEFNTECDNCGKIAGRLYPRGKMIETDNIGFILLQTSRHYMICSHCGCPTLKHLKKW